MTKKAIPLKAQAAMARYEQSREAIRSFEREHARLIEEYTQLRGALSTTIEEVKTVYREHYETIGPSFGEFSYRNRMEVDPDKLAELLDQRAMELDLLVFETKVNRKNYDRAVSEGQIPEEVVRQVERRLPPAIVSPKVE